MPPAAGCAGTVDWKQNKISRKMRNSGPQSATPHSDLEHVGPGRSGGIGAATSESLALCRRRSFHDVRVLKRPLEIVCPFKVCAEATFFLVGFLFRPSSPFQLETRLLSFCLHPLHFLALPLLPSTSSIFLIHLCDSCFFLGCCCCCLVTWLP